MATDPAGVEAALDGEARVVIVRLDRARNLELHRELAAAAAAALAAA